MGPLRPASGGPQLSLTFTSLTLSAQAATVTLPAAIIQTLPASFDILTESSLLPCAFLLLYVLLAWVRATLTSCLSFSSFRAYPAHAGDCTPSPA